jgi:SAM-dependent methyltransferase
MPWHGTGNSRGPGADAFVASGELDRPESAGPADGERDVPYLPTDQHVVNKMLEMAKVGRGDYLFDLGCGDGRIVITAAKLGARALGIDIDLQRLRECHHNLRHTELRDRIEFRRQSFFDVDLRDATVVALYLLPAINRRLRPKLLRELRPGARIVAQTFAIADWEPDVRIEFKHRPVMMWIVPAWVEGEYRCRFVVGGERKRGVLTLRRRYQVLSGELMVGRGRFAVRGRVRGTEVVLEFPAGRPMGFPARLEAMWESGRLVRRGGGRGGGGGEGVVWCGLR